MSTASSPIHDRRTIAALASRLSPMEVTETLSDGLKREFQVQVPAADLEARVTERLGELKDRVQLRGFRPGKVPVAHLKKIYGKAVMAETIEAVIRELNAKIVSDRGLKLAMEPKVTIPNEEAEVAKLIGGQSDLAYTLALEILPKIELGNFQGIKLERLVAEVTDARIDEALGKIAEQNRPFAAKAEGAKVEKGDRVVIDFTGTLDGAPFEGGSGGDVGVNVGSGTFIPGFEDQLIGLGAGETRLVKVTFPANYVNAQLAGKEAEFKVTAKSIEAPGTVTVDDAFAKSLGLESLDKLKEAVTGRLQQEHAGLSRQRLKRQLLDKLDEMHKFALPPTLAEDEFKNVWNAVESDLKAQGRTFADEGTTEEKAREEYRAIAERRVRLGLVLAEIGERNKIAVTEDEITRAIVERARQVPGREQEVWEYYRKNPAAVAGIRAPIFEEKVVDFLVELATVTEKQVSREQLLADDDEKGAAG
jgi:trigger factor